jgi:CYTH domain-containing protein
MPEIERKFLVDVSVWTPSSSGTLYRQGYLSSDKERTVRVRLQGAKGKLTIKGPTRGVTREEYEYDIPMEDAHKLLSLCLKPLVEKTRYVEMFGGLAWEVDVFHGDNDGLVVAEVELTSEDQVVRLPPWALKEVSDDPRYFNANLVKFPYSTWKEHA